MKQPDRKKTSQFEKAAAESSNSFLGDLWSFLKENKKWWLLPLITVFFILGILVLLSSTGVAPFIYTLF